ncbi:unnamed protein product [Adineta steineri]|uniref:Uncharacterized protein n=1 Tax=Adineta steineri TaxID=433720 RepID=A0A813WHG7_9BILA|nr:unnamed protein product [Adineta steineri]
MRRSIYLIFCYILIEIQCKSIPFINNAVLISIRPKLNTTILINLTCDQCICSVLSNSSILAVNCYANFSCELFFQYPRTYTIQSMNNSRLYFVRNIFPNASNPCCVSNITLILQKLQNAMANAISTSVNIPRCLLLNSNGSLITIEQPLSVPSYLDRFDPQTLTRLEHISINPLVTNIAFNPEKYFIGMSGNSTISVFTKGVSNNFLVYVNNINAPSTASMSAVRDMIFLNNGQTMVVASASNNRLYFFSLINNTNYTMTSYITLNYIAPHGLLHVNDSYFYATSWTNTSIYAYNYNATISNWTQTLFVNAYTTSTSYAAHVLIDDCNRRWFTIQGYGIRIYNENGINLGNWSLGAGYFDTLLLDNYVVLLSNTVNSTSTRIDPQITCDDG